MFTGIVEAKRPVAAAHHDGSSLHLGLELGEFAEGVRVGDSIALAGCCLTVESLDGTVATFHLMAETLGLTTFGRLGPGSEVNIERSLRVGDRLGGHLVSGHVDGLGTVTRVEVGDGQTDITIELPERLRRLVIPKGSISIDGVSLTIAVLDGLDVTVCLIPHTLEITTLGLLKVGDQVQLEMDMIGKWIIQLAEPHVP